MPLGLGVGVGWRGRGSCGALAFHTGVLAFHSARRPRSSAHRRRMRPSALCSMLLFAPLVSQLQPRDPHGAHASHRHQRRRHRCASGDGDGFTRWYPSVRSGTPSGRARPGTDQPLPLHTPLSYLSRHRNRQASEPPGIGTARHRNHKLAPFASAGTFAAACGQASTHVEPDVESKAARAAATWRFGGPSHVSARARLGLGCPRLTPGSASQPVPVSSRFIGRSFRHRRRGQQKFGRRYIVTHASHTRSTRYV